MVLDPIPQSLPVHIFGSRPQPPTSRDELHSYVCFSQSHIWMRHTCVCHTCEHLYRTITHTNAPRDTCEHMCDVTHWYVNTCVTHSHVNTCVTWRIHMCDCAIRAMLLHFNSYDKTRSYVWRDALICMTWHVHMCDLFACVCVTWLIHTCGMNDSCVWLCNASHVATLPLKQRVTKGMFSHSHVVRICSEYVQNMFRICSLTVLLLHFNSENLWLRVCSLSSMLSEYLQNIFRISSEYVLSVSCCCTWTQTTCDQGYVFSLTCCQNRFRTGSLSVMLSECHVVRIDSEQVLSVSCCQNVMLSE